MLAELNQLLECIDPWAGWTLLCVFWALVCALAVFCRLGQGLPRAVAHTSWMSAFMDCERRLAEKRARLAAEEARMRARLAAEEAQMRALAVRRRVCRNKKVRRLSCRRKGG